MGVVNYYNRVIISKLIELLQKDPNSSNDILEIKAAAWALVSARMPACMHIIIIINYISLC